MSNQEFTQEVSQEVAQEVQHFKFEDAQTFRTVKIDGEPWFVAKDVCECLQILNKESATRGLPDKYKGSYNIRTLGGKQDVTIINEPGLYQLVFRSNKEEAVKFREWIFEEVLPQIRETGTYSAANPPTAPRRPEIPTDTILEYTFQGQQFRATMLDGEPWFVARDICVILRIYRIMVAVKDLDDDEKRLHVVNPYKAGRAAWLVNRVGLFRMIFNSSNANAPELKKWLQTTVFSAGSEFDTAITPPEPQQATRPVNTARVGDSFALGLVTPFVSNQYVDTVVSSNNEQKGSIIRFHYIYNQIFVECEQIFGEEWQDLFSSVMHRLHVRPEIILLSSNGTSPGKWCVQSKHVPKIIRFIPRELSDMVFERFEVYYLKLSGKHYPSLNYFDKRRAI